jgi:predicted nucleotidyltransferase
MNLPSYFRDFLSEIEPSPSYKQDQQTGHKTLRKRLAEDDAFKALHVNTFLQGSYKRNTAIHPGKDVDIVVVTSLDPDTTTPKQANAILSKVLRKYYDNVAPQNRSYCVSLDYVTMDVVLATSRQLRARNSVMESARRADSLDAEDEWTSSPLLIPDRDLGVWVETHPKAQLAWTTNLNTRCGGYFVPLVKLFKWWRKETYQQPKYPKGYVLERLVGECVDTTKRDHAEGFVALLENIEARYSYYAQVGLVPKLPDAGVPAHDVAHRLAPADFKAFMERVATALPNARAALAETDIRKSADLWGRLFHSKFPEAQASRASFPPVPVLPNKPAGFA